MEPPQRPVLAVTGAVLHPTQVGLAELLAGLPRREQRSDLHCVTTWSALDLAWSGVAFSHVLERLVAAVQPDPRARWLRLTGLDGFASCLLLADAAVGEGLLADGLDGAPLTPDQGAPVRLVAPRQYGYKSVKHLATVEFSRSYPGGSAGWKEHPRGRVGWEERSRLLPGPLWRAVWPLALPVARRAYRDR